MKFTRNARKLIAAVALTGAAIALPAVRSRRPEHPARPEPRLPRLAASADS